MEQELDPPPFFQGLFCSIKLILTLVSLGKVAP